MWGASWYINAAKSYLRQIESIISSSYKIALALPRNSSNKVCWRFSGQSSFESRVAQSCDNYICRASFLCKGRILNKLKFLGEKLITGNVSRRKLPFLIYRWNIVEPRLKSLRKFKIHPYFTHPFKDKFIQTEFNLVSGKVAEESNDPNKVFNQLISEFKRSSDEIMIYTDGSRTKIDILENEGYLVGCAIFIPNSNESFSFKLDPLTSSFTAEALAIDKVFQLIELNSWHRVNIC